MNALIFTQQVAGQIIANQTGNHRLAPMALTDGRYFLMADVLSDEKFASHLIHAEYTILPFSQIQSLLPVSEEEIN